MPNCVNKKQWNYCCCVSVFTKFNNLYHVSGALWHDLSRYSANLEPIAQTSLTLPRGAVHLIYSRGLALITRMHGGTLPEKRCLLPAHCDSLTLAMCCLFVCVWERERYWNRKQETGTYRKHAQEVNQAEHTCFSETWQWWIVLVPATTLQLIPPPTPPPPPSPRPLGWCYSGVKPEKNRMGFECCSFCCFHESC